MTDTRQNGSRRPRLILTGPRVLCGLLAVFALVLGVNVLMALKAVETFPGLEVENSYVASQTFDVEKHAQERLGWSAQAQYAGGVLRIEIRDRAGAPARLRDVSVLIGRLTMAKDDVRPVLSIGPDGVPVAPVALAPGFWRVFVHATAADGTLFQQRLDLFVAR